MATDVVLDASVVVAAVSPSEERHSEALQFLHIVHRNRLAIYPTRYSGTVERRTMNKRKGAASAAKRKIRSLKTAAVASRQDQYEDAYFKTIDLDVRSQRSLAALFAAWPRARDPLNGLSRSRWLIVNPDDASNTEAAAKGLLRHIERLKDDALECWNRAHRKVFDIGVQAGGPGRHFDEVRLTPKTLRRIGEVGADIQITVYGPELRTPEPAKRSD